MAMVVLVALAVVPTVPAMIIPAFVSAVTMLFLVTRNILMVVPVVLHKIDPLAAGVVFAAVLVPMFGVARRYAQIDRRTIHRTPLDYFRLTIEHLWLMIAADIESAIETWLADAERNSNVGSECRGGNGGSGYYCCDQETFHVES